MSFDRPGWLLAGIAGVVVFTLLYRWFSLRKTSRDLAYSNVAFFVAATKPRPWIPRGADPALDSLARRHRARARRTASRAAGAGPRRQRLHLHRHVRIDGLDRHRSDARRRRPTQQRATFIAASPAGTKIGIIAFSGAAGIVQPLSADHEAVVAVARPGTAARTARPRSATRCSWLRATSRLKAIASSYSSPTASTTRGPIRTRSRNTWAPITFRSTRSASERTPARSFPGTNQEATIDEDALRSYAQASGGAYARVESASQLRDALGRLGRITTLERKHVDASLEFAIAGALGMIVAFFAGFGLGRYP